MTIIHEFIMYCADTEFFSWISPFFFITLFQGDYVISGTNGARVRILNDGEFFLVIFKCCVTLLKICKNTRMLNH